MALPFCMEIVYYILPTFALSDPSPHGVVCLLEQKVCLKGCNLNFFIYSNRLLGRLGFFLDIFPDFIVVSWQLRTF